MNFANKRVKKLSKTEIILKKIQRYAYIETVAIMALFLLVGYFFNNHDVCFIHTQLVYPLILLTIITLFHGFENGLVAVGILSIAMLVFYSTFPYIEFLVLLMMTMIFSEFHYFWTKKIKTLQVEAKYKTTKLNELSRAFYTLKISHDQLERNYVIKPMSIRSAIEDITSQEEYIDGQHINETATKFYSNFLSLLERSFSVNSALIIHRTSWHSNEELTEKNSTITYSSLCEKYSKKDILESYLLDRAINFKQPVYISDKTGEPTVHSEEESKFLVAIPFVLEDHVASVLLIDRMPFMAFNKENLTSISILLEYLSISISHSNISNNAYKIRAVKNRNFNYEYNRLRYINDKYKVNSSVMILKLESELQTMKVHTKIVNLLRALDMVTIAKFGGYHFIILLFPLSDSSSALGFLKRLKSNIDYDQDRQFETMHFDINQLKLLNKYIEDDYDE